MDNTELVVVDISKEDESRVDIIRDDLDISKEDESRVDIIRDDLDISKEDESRVDIIIDNLEDCFDDIGGRLTISRMASDSIIKGMVAAVEQEAVERIGEKELEVVGVKEMLHIYHEGDDETKSPVVYNEPREAVGTGIEQDGLIRYGSLENGDEWCNNKKTDHFHRKLSTNYLSPSTLEGNGNPEDSKHNKHENLDPVSLKHFSREELIIHYNSEITKMKRNHESQVQEKTEENFRLKRELMRERDSSLPLKKDKEFDMLIKKIPDFISKLDSILGGNEKVHPLNENIEFLSPLKGSLESLHSENHRLRDTLLDKENECTSLSSQLSDAMEKVSQQQLTEKQLLHSVHKLECEFSLIQDVYKCLLEDITGEFRCIAEESHLKQMLVEEMYEIIFIEAGHGVQPSSKSEIEDADMESIIRLGLLDVIFRETLKDTEVKIRSLIAQYVNENHIRVNLEMESCKSKEALRLEAAEKEKLEQEMLMLTSKLTEKEKVAQEVTDALKEEKGKMDLAFEELNSLRAKTAQQQNIILENRKELESTILLVFELLTAVSDFVSRVNEDISRNNLRLESLSSVFHCLIKKANILKATGLQYKQRLETRCSDLEKAEAEVDLLADEVNTLRNLLEGIYKKLDHYSPILRHYPGITETLELVKRELIGESREPV